jgi:hypothetical protein
MRKLVIIKQQTTKEVCVGVLNYLTDSIHKTLAGEARIVQQEEPAIARQRRSERFSAATNQHTTR